MSCSSSSFPLLSLPPYKDSRSSLELLRLPSLQFCFLEVSLLRGSLLCVSRVTAVVSYRLHRRSSVAVTSFIHSTVVSLEAYRLVIDCPTLSPAPPPAKQFFGSFMTVFKTCQEIHACWQALPPCIAITSQKAVLTQVCDFCGFRDLLLPDGNRVSAFSVASTAIAAAQWSSTQVGFGNSFTVLLSM